MRLPTLVALLLTGCAVPCAPLTTTSPGAPVAGTVGTPAAWGAAGPAEVAVADAAGNPVPGLVHQRTDGNGAYAIGDVPADGAYTVVARVPLADGREVTLSSVPGAPIDLGSTVVTQLATQGLAGAPGKVDPATFQKAADLANQKLAAGPTPADPAAALQQAKAWSTDDAAFRDAVAAVRQQAAAAPAAKATQAPSGPLDALSPVY
ncbi:MAG: hypothetical protein JWM80_4775 [Cyanobacteria bacterium RYN_339]|nr:hypothetical protein [Cyanobacteria bacterium RYN_339]